MKRILICDRLLAGQSNADWKEGWELFYAFSRLGIDCDIAGPNCPISETYIPHIQDQYDFLILSENHYYDPPGWKWWNWDEIKIPKMFWAIDTHSINYNPWLEQCKFDYVGLNNKADIEQYKMIKRFYFPYGVSSKRFNRNLAHKKEYDVTFIGSLTPEREAYINKFNIKHISALGYEYIKEMQKSKICFNKSVSYDLNAKYFEIIASGTFMLSNYNQVLLDFVRQNEYIEKMMYKDDDELRHKIDYYLEHNEEREHIAANARKYIIENHSYESRCKLLLDNIIK